MNVKLRVLSAGALFFIGQAVSAQKTKKDTITDIKQIEEVVVLGYNNKRLFKESNVSATIVTPELIENRPNINALQSLQGQAPGLYIASSSGSPGSNRFAAQIRGIGSLVGYTNPLYVVDGVPVSETYWKNLNPDDITSISVLKDAEATSIFGNRGANGVILVTTKSGKYNQKLTFTYSGQTGITILQDHKYNIADARQTLQFEKDNGAGKGASLTQDEINNWAIDTNWKKVFFRAGFSQNHNLSFQGGGENLGMFTSFNYLNQEGIVPNTNFQRFGLRTNINGKTNNDKFTYQINLGLNFSRRNQLDQETRNDIDGNVLQNPLQGLLTSLPYLDKNVYVNGRQLFQQFGSPSFQIVPYMLMDYLSPGNIPNRYDEFRLLANVQGNYKFTPELNLTVQAGTDYTNEFRNFARAPWSYLAVASQGAQEFGGIENQINVKDLNFNLNLKLNYHKTFGDVHSIDASIYSEYLRYFRTQNSLQQTGLDPKTWEFGSGTGWIAFNTATPTQYLPQITASKSLAGLYAYFGTFSYDYDKRFGISGTIRRDASYKFLADNKWGTFWSVGGRWTLSSEDFMKESIFTLLKLRASYGTQGNQNIIDPTRNQQSTGLNPIYLGSQVNRDLGSTTGTGYGLLPTYNITIGNPNAKWETINQANVGVDFDVKNGLLSGALDLYNKKTEDMFNVLPVSGVTGQYTINGNFGDMVNKGIELSLRSNVIKKTKFGVTLFANASFNHNEILTMPVGNANPANPFLSGINSTAIASNSDIINAEHHLAYEYFLVPYIGVNNENGKLQFLDRNGNVTENPTNNDRRFTDKSYLPKYQGGFGANIQFSNFYLDTYFTFTAKVWRMDSDLESLSDPNNVGVFPITTDLLNAWTPNNNSNYPGLDAASVTLGNTFSDRFLRDSSYIRLRNISFGYNVSKELLKNVGLTNFKVFVQGENLVTWSKWRGFDAESSSTSTYGGYPTPRIITFGIEAQF